MAQRVFFFNKLREGVTAAAYEQWIRDVDYPLARSLPTIETYVVTRLEGHLEGDAANPYDYVEVIEVTDLDDYRRSLAGKPEIEDFFKEWSSYVGESIAVYGEVIE